MAGPGSALDQEAKRKRDEEESLVNTVLIPKAMPEVSKNLMALLDRWRDDRDVDAEGNPSYRYAMNRLNLAIASTNLNNPDHLEIERNIRAPLRSSLENLSDAKIPSLQGGGLTQMTDSIIEGLKGITLPSFGKPFSQAQASSAIMHANDGIEKGGNPLLSDQMKQAIKNFMPIIEPNDPRRIKPDGALMSDAEVAQHNEYSEKLTTKLKKIAEIKKKDEERIDAEKAAAAKADPNAKKKDPDHVEKAGPSAGHMGGGEKGSLPNQLWDRAMYEDKAILMAMALDIALLIPILLESFVIRSCQHGLGHGILMTIGMEELPQGDIGLDRWVLQQLGVINENTPDNNAGPVSETEKLKKAELASQRAAAESSSKLKPGGS